MTMLPMDEEQRRRELAGQANQINAILSMSDLGTGAALADRRSRGGSQYDKELATIRGLELRNQLQTDRDVAQHNRALERIEAMQGAGTWGGNKVPAGIVSTGMKEEMAFNDYNTALNAAMEVIEEGGDFKGVADMAIGLAREWDMPTFSNFINSVAYSADEKKARSFISAAHAAQRQAVSGMAVTESEIGFNADNDPTSPGISQQDAVNRLQERQQLINNHRATLGMDPMESVGERIEEEEIEVPATLSPKALKYLQGN